MKVRRPLHALTCLGLTGHQVFELLGGAGIFFQRYVGMGGALGLWAYGVAAWLRVAARGSRRWDAPLAFAAGSSVATVVLHFDLWPWSLHGPLPLLDEAEGFPPGYLPAYNAVLYAWLLAAIGAIALDTPPPARRWSVTGFVAALPLAHEARRHFLWVHEQSQRNPSWWNRSGRRGLARELQ